MNLNQRLLVLTPYHSNHLALSLQSPCFSLPRTHNFSSLVSASLDPSTTTQEQHLTARERRQLRNEKRETKTGYNWREEVEERLINIKPAKKKKVHWAEELNLDNLAHLGPQWWIIRVSRVRGHETADLVARLLSRNYPDIKFKVYAPAVQVKRKLKNGALSVKPKPVFPGCVFLWCVLNKEIHDFIREIDGVGGFIGSKVGSIKRQINKPRPVSDDDMEEVFRKTKEEQEKFDQSFEEEQGDGNDLTKSTYASKEKGGSKKTSESLAPTSAKKKGSKLPTTGSTVRIVSGTFSEFEGTLRKVSRKAGKATVEFTIFGKETLVDLDINEIAAETS